VSFVRPVDATDDDELLVEACVALFVGVGVRGAEIEVEDAGLLMEELGVVVQVDGTAEVGGVHEVVRPAEKLVFVLDCRPCTSRSALQARWNKRVIELYSL
jgi:hypothetical protein